MKYLILFTTLIFAAEMEVDGNLKVTGNIDASGQPINNVGAPLSMTDAVNAGILQGALSDDGVYEYKIILVKMSFSNQNDIYNSAWYEMEQFASLYNGNSIHLLNDHITLLFNDGWKLDSINGDIISWWVLKKPISEE